jgi:hypothetical protein
VAVTRKPGGAEKVEEQPGSIPPPINGEYGAVPAAACDFHTPGAVTSPVAPPHAAPTGSTTLPTGKEESDGEGVEEMPDEDGVGERVAEPVGEKEGVFDEEGVTEGVVERVGVKEGEEERVVVNEREGDLVCEPVELPVAEGVGDLVLAGEAPALHVGVMVLVRVTVTEGVGGAEGQGGSYASVALVTRWKVKALPVAAVKPQKADEERSDACKLMGVLRTLRAPPLGVVRTVRVPPAAHAS